MTLAVTELKASYAFVERNINLVKRYWGWELVWMLYTIANSLAVVLIATGTNSALNRDGAGGAVLSDADIDRFVIFLALGALVWHYLAVVFQTVSEMISWERWEGTIEYTFMAPIRRGTHMVGTAAFSLVYGFLHTAVVLVIIVLVFDVDVSNANFAAGAAVLIAGSLSLIGIGIMGAVLPLLYPERGVEMTHVIQAALVLISGVYITASEMPEPLATMSIFSPATYVIEGMRSAIIDGQGFTDLWPTIVGLILSGFVMIPVGVWVFSIGERYAKRTGRLKRSG